MFEDAEGFSELFKGYLPYYLLIALPIFIIISPTPVLSSHEFSAYRMHQYDLHGNTYGCRSSAINLEARSLEGYRTSRHCVVVSLQDLTVEIFHNLQSKAGALLIVLPETLNNLTVEEKQVLMLLEGSMLTQDVSIPVYFTTWSQDVDSILNDINDVGSIDDKSKPALDSIINSVAANGYQIVVSGGSHAQKSDIKVVTLQGNLNGQPGSDGKLPTIAIVAYYDSLGVAPEMSMGADSNASGASVLLELARIFSHLYSNVNTVGHYNLVFLLTGGGKLNYMGSKKWLEDQLDSLDGSIIQDATYIMCLDNVASGNSLYMHVSKPPKENTPVNIFYKELKLAAGKYQSNNQVTIEGIHKKINLADDILAWEHERYSIRRLPAFTLSTIKNYKDQKRSTILDRTDTISIDKLALHTQIIADALASQIYNISSSQIFSNSLKVEKDSLKSWMEYIGKQPRSAQLLCDKNNALVSALKEGMSKYLKDVKATVLTPDKRDPEFMLYEGSKAILNIYRVKPAIFDLVLTIAIIAYLGIIYLFIQNFSILYNFVCKLTESKAKIN